MMAGMDRPLRLGCVSYLNAKPLIDGIERFAPGCPVRFDVPSGLLHDLERGDVDVALCPVIDYFRSTVPLAIVPVGGIGCDGPTLTVRIYSQVPLDAVEAIHADTDSHTSVALTRVLMRRRLGRDVPIIDYAPRRALPPLPLGEGEESASRERVLRGKRTFGVGSQNPLPHPLPEAEGAAADEAHPPTMLLIGDKVVTDSPAAVRYPHQLDLGEAWHEATGLPFVFAVWMCRAGAAVDPLPAQLDACRRRNAARIDELVAHYAPRHGWPSDLARHYLGDLLKFDIGPRQLQAITRFGDEAAAAGVIPAPRPLVLHNARPQAAG